MTSNVHRAPLVGRHSEREAIDAFLRRGERLALVVEGERGMGKSAVWRAAVEQAAARGYRVLRTQPAEPDSRLPFAGAADLLRGTLAEVFPMLVPAQRTALRCALALDESATPADPLTVASAFRSALEIIRSVSPVLVAVDDAHWLDSASSRVLGYALRRLDPRALVLLTVRPNSPAELEVELTDVDRIMLRPLSAAALSRLLTDVFGSLPPRHVVGRIHHDCRGNPSFAIELAHAMKAEGDGDATSLPYELASVLRRRVSGLPDKERRLLLCAAIAATPTLDLLDQLADATTVAAVLATGLLEQEGVRVRFEHPLVASLLCDDARLRERQDVHRKLAELVPTREERALHRALATQGPDEDVAAELEEAASSAVGRGAPAEAAQLLEKAASLTLVDDHVSWRRRQEAATRQALVADNAVFAHALVEELLERSRPSEREAGLLLRIDSAPTNALRLEAIDRALHEVKAPNLRGELRLRAAEAAELAGAYVRSIDDALIARDISVDCGDVDLNSRASAHVARVGFAVGQRLLVAELDAAVKHEAQQVAGIRSPLQSPSFARGSMLVNEDDFDAALPVLERVHETAARTGAPLAQAVVLLQLVFLHCRAGRWEASATAARQKQELSWQAGYNDPPPGAQFAQAYVAGYRGELETARQRAAACVEVARQVGSAHFEASGLWCAGFTALSAGAAADATVSLREATALLHAYGLVSLPTRPVEPDLAEALIALGELEEAEHVINVFERRISTLKLAWTDARTARVHASIAAARGELEDALASTARALHAHRLFADPFERARTLLVHGGALRRAQQKRAARTTLSDALETFTRLGAATWTEETRAELDRIGGRSTATSGLSANERRIADLAADGLSNKEISEALFLSTKTVEATLSRVYRKLGVRSRSAIGRALAEQT